MNFGQWLASASFYLGSFFFNYGIFLLLGKGTLYVVVGIELFLIGVGIAYREANRV